MEEQDQVHLYLWTGWWRLDLKNDHKTKNTKIVWFQVRKKWYRIKKNKKNGRNWTLVVNYVENNFITIADANPNTCIVHQKISQTKEY